MKQEKSYYVFICLDGIPTFELLLDYQLKAIENYEQVKWDFTKYVILDFKSAIESDSAPIMKGYVKYYKKIMTKRVIYYHVNIAKAMEEIEAERLGFYAKSEAKIMLFSKVLFQSEPKEFLEYIKKNKILPIKDMNRLSEALKNQNKEQEIIDSWQNVSRSE